MNSENLKSRMSQLWKNTFHDSDSYISLVFDNYFDPKFAEFEEDNGEVIAGLIGIPYEFGNAESKLKGLYLCGLATHPHYRSRGIMTQMLNRINRKAKENGFAFTFLIPSDEGLRKYYRDRDYVNAFYRVVDNYTSLHNFELEYDSVLAEQKEKVAALKKRYFESLSSGFIDDSSLGNKEIITEIIRLINDIENAQVDLQLYHSVKDIELLIKENAISGGRVYYVVKTSGQVSAVAFTTKSDYGINIHKLYSSDLASKYKVLDAIKRAEPEYAIRHYVSSIEMDRNALWSRTYGSFMTEAPQVASISVTERVYSLAAHAKVYGMARILDLPEILKFQANQRKDLKYSILMKSSEDDFLDQIETKDGNVKIKKLKVESVNPSKIAYLMSQRDISEILFRRRDTDNLITEAFGIPSVNGSICLLLD